MENYRALEDIKDFERLSLTGGGDFLKKKQTHSSKLPALGTAMMMSGVESTEIQ